MATETNEWINKWQSYWFLCNFFWAFRLILWIKDPAKLSTENASLLIACLVCSRARRACVLVCLHVHMLNMPASLRTWRALFLTCLTCSRPYVFTCLACLLVLCACCAQISYVLTCSFTSLTSFVIFSLHWKIPKILISKNLFLFRGVLRTYLNNSTGVF